MPSSFIARIAVTAAAASSVALAGACAPMKPPLRNAGPAVSRSGVALAVVRQSCGQAKEPDFHDWDLVEERVELELKNPSTEAVTIHRDRFRLLAPDGTALKPLTWLAGDPLTVEGGSTGVVQLRFMARGGPECTQEMRIDADGGVTQGERAISFAPVSFVPARAL
jgi:hypothetical protein